MKALLHPVALLKAIHRSFFLEGISVHAAGLAFKTLLSLIPLGVVVATIYAVVEFKEPEPDGTAAEARGSPADGTGEAGTTGEENLASDSLGRLRQTLDKFFVPEQAQKATLWIEKQVRLLRSSSTPVTFVGLLLLCGTAFFLFRTVEIVMNRIYRVRVSRSTGAQILAFWAFLTLGPLLIGASFYATHLFSKFTPEEWPGLGFLAQAASYEQILTKVLPFTLTLVMFFFLTWLAPNTHVRVLPALVGALFSAAVWEVAKWGISYFLTGFVSYDYLYGGLATGIILLLWLYLSWYLALFGCTLAYHLQYPPGGADWPGTEARARLALALVVDIGKTYRSGASPEPFRRLCRKLNCPEGLLKEMAAALEKADILVRTQRPRSGYVLARAPESLRLTEVYQALGAPVGGLPAGATKSSVGRFFQDLEAGAASTLGTRSVADILETRDGSQPLEKPPSTA